MIKNAAESGVDIITVFKYALMRFGDPHVPKTKEVAGEGSTVEKWRTFISICWVRRRNEVVQGALVVRSIGAVDVDASFSFLCSPFNRAEK